MPSDIEEHLSGCDACSHLVTGLREEAQGLSLSIGGLWFTEGISCPHKDILLSWMEGGLGAAQSDYIDFHLNLINCPECNAALGEWTAQLDETPLEPIREAKKHSLDQTRSWINSNASEDS